jgi:hypothetical protein
MDEPVGKPRSADEQRMVDLALAANAYESLAHEIFAKHKVQTIPILLMLAANTLSCVTHGDGRPMVVSDEVTEADVRQAYDDSLDVIDKGPAYLMTFLYSLGGHAAKKIIRDNLMMAINRMAERKDA